MKDNLNIGSRVDATFANNTLTNLPGILEKWCLLNIPAYCDTFGGMYSWTHALQYWDTNFTQPPYPAQGICPPGWHIPTSPEWQILWNFVDSCTGTYKTADYGFGFGFQDSNAVGNKLKLVSECYLPRTNPIDCGVSGFEMKLGGFLALGFFWLPLTHVMSEYWAATRGSVLRADLWEIQSTSPGFGLGTSPPGMELTNGGYIRCLKD